MSCTLGKPHADGWITSIYGCGKKRHNTAACSNKFIQEENFGEFVLNYIANIIRAKDSITQRTTLDALEKKLLRGLAFSEVSSIDSRSLESIRDMLLAGQTGFEYNPPIAVSGTSDSINEKEVLNRQYKKKKMALDRLKALYLYGDGG